MRVHDSRKRQTCVFSPFHSFFIGFLRSLVFLTAIGLSGCGGGSGSSTGPVAFAPVLSVISPSSVFVNSLPVTLLVGGTNFTSSSQVLWNGSVRPTTFVAATQLQAAISSSDLAAVGTATVTVSTPAPGGGTSAGVTFSINPNPAPVVSTPDSIDPRFATQGDAALTLTVSGSNFVPSSVILWNGGPRPTTVVDSTKLTAQISSLDLATFGVVNITVSTPAPGGGVSAGNHFFVGFPMFSLNQLAKDIVYDPSQKLLYASAPDSAATNPDTIVAIDPSTGAITQTVSTGLNPDILAISGDSTFLYVATDGRGTKTGVTPVAGSVQQFALPAFTTGISYPLNVDDVGNPASIADLQVAPGAPHTTVISQGQPLPGQVGLTVFDDATPRPTSESTIFNGFDTLQWGATAASLFSAQAGFGNFYTLSVDNTGVSLVQTFSQVFPRSQSNPIHYDPVSNLLYSNVGTVIDPATGTAVATFDFGPVVFARPISAAMIDSASNSAYFALERFDAISRRNYEIDKYDLTTHALLTVIPIGVDTNMFGDPRRLIRWGTNGLALVMSSPGTPNVFILKNAP